MNLPRRRRPLFPPFNSRLRLPLEVRDLPERVDARVRSARAADLHLRAENFSRRLRQLPLPPAAVRLPPPTAVARPLVLDLKPPDSHAQALTLFKVSESCIFSHVEPRLWHMNAD